MPYDPDYEWDYTDEEIQPDEPGSPLEEPPSSFMLCRSCGKTDDECKCYEGENE